MQQQHIRQWLGAIACVAVLALGGCKGVTTPGASGTSTTSGTPGTSTTGTPGTTTTGTPGTAPTSTPGVQQSWGSLLYASTTGRGNALTITNINPASGKTATVASIPNSSQGGVDAISPNGQLVAYHTLSGTTASYSVANIGGVGATQSFGQVPGALAGGAWEHDNAHFAVTSDGVISILSAGAAPQTITGIHAAQIVGFSPDNSSLYFVASGYSPTSLGPGALYRLPLNDTTHPVELTPREGATHFLLSQDGQTVYYNNTGSSGTQGIYSVNAQNGGTPTLLRQTSGVPVGFSSNGALLYAVIQPAGVALMQFNPSGTDTTVVYHLVNQGNIPNLGLDIAVAPDGSGVAALAMLQGTGFAITFNDLTQTTPTPKQLVSMPTASLMDLVGFDTALLAAGS